LGAQRARAVLVEPCLVERAVVEAEIGGRIDLHLHVIFADADDVAALQLVRILAAERAVVVVDEGAVAARVLEQVAAFVEDDARVTPGDVTHVIGQHPVVLGRASYASARDSENECALVAHSMAMFADDAQPERHVLPSGP
jgi:hypothetical protein